MLNHNLTDTFMKAKALPGNSLRTLKILLPNLINTNTMIGYLTGKIISKKPTQIMLDVNGVGYIVNISVNTFEKLPEKDTAVSLFTYLSVKEDSMDLYGFSSLPEKEIFQLLISVSGVGPKLGQSILSGIQIDDLYDAIQSGNIQRMIAIPGVGRKTAERLILELRDKLEKVEISGGSIPDSSMKIKNDAVTALVNLGYNQKTAEKAIRKILDENKSVSIEDLVKESLKILNN